MEIDEEKKVKNRVEMRRKRRDEEEEEADSCDP